jgi:hypothetical protein
MVEYIRREEISLRESTSAFHHKGATFGFKSRTQPVIFVYRGILKKTSEGQNNLIQKKQIIIKCIKSLPFIIFNLLIIFSRFKLFEKN